jgi:hypothetical protein
MPVILLTLFIIAVIALLLYFKLKNSSGFRSWFFRLTEDDSRTADQAIEDAQAAVNDVRKKRDIAESRQKRLAADRRKMSEYLGDEQIEDEQIDSGQDEEETNGKGEAAEKDREREEETQA